ncbi:hypothetical protein Taro_021419 [Colocasia esculenta]|uniref:DNA-3-methyladenine glycosylase I n=1 Tax=Colocasia esculenta TaxID=4460 RepID=A0A843VBF3_COLES|nr:hypothetical protein [Colocasia esculenta]
MMTGCGRSRAQAGFCSLLPFLRPGLPSSACVLSPLFLLLLLERRERGEPSVFFGTFLVGIVVFLHSEVRIRLGDDVLVHVEVDQRPRSLGTSVPMGYELVQRLASEESRVSRAMPKAKVVRSPKEPGSELRQVLPQAGNRARACQTPGDKAVVEETKKSVRRPGVCVPSPVRNVSADSSCSSDSSSSRSSVKGVSLQRTRRQSATRPVKVVPEGEGVLAPLLLHLEPASVKRRCAWITLNSDPLYVSFHDEEWGVPVRDDRKLFELLVLSQALAELSWPTILRKRETFREMFDNFDPASVAKFSEKKIISLKSCGTPLLSEVKLRAVVENAKQLLKVVEEFGSLSNYCWGFVNHKPIVNGFRFPRQVPVRTPKAEAISKDLIKRGFHCTGPTVVYSFMQAAGIVNDHVSSCFRYKECNLLNEKTNAEGTATLAKELDIACSLQP